MSLHRHPSLYVAPSPRGGRGVFAAEDIPQGSVVELCPVIVLPPEDKNRIHASRLHDYYFIWEPEGCTAIALGYGSLYNHDNQPNADYEMYIEEAELLIRAQRDIGAGEEICIDYTDGQDRSTLWF